MTPSDNHLVFVPLRRPTKRALTNLIVGGGGPFVLIAVCLSFSRDNTSPILVGVLLLLVTISGLYVQSFLYELSARVELSDSALFFSSMFGRKQIQISAIKSILPITTNYDEVYGLEVRGDGPKIQLRMGSFSWAQLEQIRDTVVARAAAMSSVIQT